MRSRNAPQVGQSSASGSASAGRSHTPLSTACVSRQECVALEKFEKFRVDGDKISPRGTPYLPVPTQGRVVAPPRLLRSSPGLYLSPSPTRTRSPRLARLVVWKSTSLCEALTMAIFLVSVWDFFGARFFLEPRRLGGGGSTRSFAHRASFRPPPSSVCEASCTVEMCITRTRARLV